MILTAGQGGSEEGGRGWVGNGGEGWGLRRLGSSGILEHYSQNGGAGLYGLSCLKLILNERDCRAPTALWAGSVEINFIINAGINGHLLPVVQL